MKFSSNPLMFKVNNINGDRIDSTVSPMNVLGKSEHEALKAYFNGLKQGLPEADAIKGGYEYGKQYIDAYSDGFIAYNTTIATREKMLEKYSLCYFGYLKDAGFQKEIKEILLVEEMLQYKLEIEEKLLPIPLKGSSDLVFLDIQERIRIIDHKFVSRFSNEDEIDASKLLQAAFNYFLDYARLGKIPYSITFREYKVSENKDKSIQTKEYEIIFGENPLIFDLFYRLYDDITNALMGKQVYIPNFNAIYDKEVSLITYIHHLDVEEEKIKMFKQLKVDNITDLLKKKLQKSSMMKKYLDTVSRNFISAKNLNYKEMTTEEKIKYKLAEHGIGVEFDSKVEGSNVTLYRYEPSIGVKMSKLEGFTKDIEQVVEKSGIRILAPIPNSGLIGFEIPNETRKFPDHLPATDGFNIALGETIIGEARRFDIRQAPHLLISGATGSGKSVFMANIIKQIIDLPKSVAEIELLDPKMVELYPFAKYGRYECEHRSITLALLEDVREMDNRYRKIKAAGCKNIEEYRQRESDMPYRFIFIEEYGDISMNEIAVEEKMIKTSDYVLLLAQKARACGIHLIISTQRPSTKIIDGNIKANFPARVCFHVSSAVDSRIILDQGGAEKLLGKGDMLFMDPEKGGLERLQGYF